MQTPEASSFNHGKTGEKRMTRKFSNRRRYWLLLGD
jgi:hypothetical protein